MALEKSRWRFASAMDPIQMKGGRKMSRFKKTGGRYGMHSGSGNFRNMQVSGNTWLQGNQFPVGGITGDTWYVDKNKAGGSGDGKSWDSAFLTITLAVATAGPYDAIFIGHGVYSETATVNITQDGLKLFGSGTSGFVWGPTSMKSNTAGDHMLKINAIGVEVAGLDFITNTTSKNAIQMSDVSTTYKTHIHDCHFGGGGTTNIGINCSLVQDTVDMHVERCEFYNYTTAGFVLSGTRTKVTDCLFFVPAAGIGLDIRDTGANRPDKLIANNMIIGSSSTDTGIKLPATEPTDGTILIYNNCVTNCSTNITAGKGDAGNVANIEYKDGVVVGQIDPT